MSLNKSLLKLGEDWKRNGSSAQEGFDWNISKRNWIQAFPKDTAFIEKLPLLIDRIEVRRICESTENSIQDKFLAVMIWGYGDRGYGPYRVTQMLDQPHALSVLEKTFELCQLGDPKGAYDFLRLNRIKILGPSYSSKFITFCTPRQVGAPIYDSFIALWVERFAKSDFGNVPTSAERWNSKTYFRYWDWIKEHSIALDCYPDDLELVIFRDAESKFSKSSIWVGK